MLQDSGLSLMRFSPLRIEPRKVISLVTLFVLSIWVVLYIKSHISEFSNVFDLSFKMVAILSGLLLLDTVVLGLFNKVLMEDFDVSLQFREWYGLSIVSNLWNYVLPFQGGAGVRALYLKKVHHFTFSNFLGTMLALCFVSFLVNSFMGLICILYIYLCSHSLNMGVVSFFSAVFVGILIIIFFSPPVPEFNNRVLKKIGEVINAWYSIRKNTRLVLNLTLIILLHAMVELLTVYYAFRAYDIHLSLYKCLLISTLLAFSVLIKLTPGSLGITEGIMVFGAKMFSITPGQSLLAAGLIRIINLGWIFGLGLVFSYILGLSIKRRNLSDRRKRNAMAG